MSLAAHVLVQRSENEYDVYYSDNGAYERQLQSVLEDNRKSLLTGESNDLGTIGSMQQVDKLNDKFGDNDQVKKVASDKALEPEPIARGVSKRAAASLSDFADLEGFYVVERGNPVSFYFPAWINPNVIVPWRENLSVKVFRSGTITPETEHEDVSEDPLKIINGESFSGSDYLDDTITERVVREEHANVYALVRKTIDKVSDEYENGDSPVVIVKTHSYDLVVEIDNYDVVDEWLPVTDRTGVYIEVDDTKTGRQIELEVAKHRFGIGGELAAMRREIEEDDLAMAQAELLIQLYRKYGDKIATFSPPPYGELIQALRQVDVRDDMADKLAREIRKN